MVLIEMASIIMNYIKILLQDIIPKVLIKMVYIKIPIINMILMVMIYMDLIKMVVIFMAIKKSSKIKTSKAKSFKDQKGKGHFNLPIALSKIYTNNSSKELINDIKQLINNLYNNTKITKQVYNMLNKAITHVQNTTF